MPGRRLGSKIEVAAEMLQCYTKFHNVLCLQQIANAADMLYTLDLLLSKKYVFVRLGYKLIYSL